MITTLLRILGLPGHASTLIVSDWELEDVIDHLHIFSMIITLSIIPDLYGDLDDILGS